MRASRIFLSLLLSVIGCSFLGCQTTGRYVRLYEGPPRSLNDVAILKLQRERFSGRSALLCSVDGQSFFRPGIFNNTEEIELLPGKHELGVRYLAGSVDRVRSPTNELRLGLICQPAHVYELRIAPLPTRYGKARTKEELRGWFWVTAWIVDAQTGQLVAGQPRNDPVGWWEP